jgi:Na+/melibiose symporter-like transporter
MHGPEGQIQAIYAKHAGISLTALAAAMLLTKLFDAVTYPLIGALSDRSHARTGTRRTWVVAGSTLSVIGVWFLLRPPPGVGAVYFGCWTAVTYLGWKTIEIPLQAWSFALSADYAQRARVQGWRAFAQIAGQLLFFTVPFLAAKLGVTDSTELDFRSLGIAAVICLVALPFAAGLFLLKVPATSAVSPASNARPKAYGLKETFGAVRGNPALLRLLAAFLPVNLLAGMSGGIAYLYVDAYLGLSRQFPAIMVTTLLLTFLGIPFWTALSARYERHRVWAIALTIGGLACVAIAPISPGDTALVACFVIYPLIAFSVSGSIIVYTMSADIVDYGRLHTHQNHGGLYVALFAFLQKSIGGVSAAMGVALAGAFGFDATAPGQTTGAILGIKLVFAIAPAVGLLVAAAIIWNYPLTRERTLQIQAALAERDREAGSSRK